MTTEEKLLSFDPFSDERDTDIKFRQVKIITTRKEHSCFFGDEHFGRPKHIIKIGEKARYEHALVDGEWGSWYACIPCVSALIEEYEDD